MKRMWKKKSGIFKNVLNIQKYLIKNRYLFIKI